MNRYLKIFINLSTSFFPCLKKIFLYILTLILSDLNRTLETLQQRVQALEKNLTPFTTGYPAMQSSYGYQMNSTPMTNGKFRESLTVIFRYIGKLVLFFSRKLIFKNQSIYIQYNRYLKPMTSSFYTSVLSYTILPESWCNLIQIYQLIILQVCSWDSRAELWLVEILVEGI